MVAMKPILFNTEMVRAILDGRKTVTRRLVKINGWKITGLPTRSTLGDVSADGVLFSVAGMEKNTATCEFAYPPYKTGDILYVRETWSPMFPNHTSNVVVGYMYKADDFGVEEYDKRYPNGKDWEWLGKWKPSIHMPKEAARLFLRVTGVRVERLQEITPADAEKEGVGNLFLEAISYGVKDYHIPVSEIYGVAKEQFAHLWDSTIKKADRDLYDWVSNPFVWVINFEQCENPKGE